MLTLRQRATLIAVVLFSIDLAAGRAVAQTTAQFPVQFDFLTPGARSMALGGAYIGAADDATAAFTNPGGLAFFGQNQFSFEARFRSLDTPFLAGGRISGTPTGIGQDTIATPIYTTDTDFHILPSFIAAVFPVSSKNLSVAVYRHDLVHLENAFFSSGPFERVTFFGVTDDRTREIPIGGTREVRIATYGGSVAYVLKDFGFGGGISVSTFRLDSDFTRFGFTSTIFSPPDTSITTARTTQHGDDVAVSGNVGVLWHASEQIGIGAAFRRGPRFSFDQRDVLIGAFDLQRHGEFKVPDVWSLGTSWTGIPHTRLMFDYNRVQYSQLKRDFVDIQAIASGRPNQLQIDDGDEFHGGAEYRTQFGKRAVALRGGAWWDPDHTVRYLEAAHDEVDRLYAATLPGGKDLMHYTFGGAIAVSRVVIDVGADLSSQSKSATTSLLVRF